MSRGCQLCQACAKGRVLSYILLSTATEVCKRPISELQNRTGLIIMSNAACAMTRPNWLDLLRTNGCADLFTSCHRRGGWGAYREAKTNCRSYLAELWWVVLLAHEFFYAVSRYLSSTCESSRMRDSEIEQFLFAYGVSDRRGGSQAVITMP